jgi:glycine C-acetyltransferase
LGLANNDEINRAAIKAIEQYGYGMASVRFICGTHEIHKNLEQTLSSFLHKEDTILYSSCFDANTGLFETILDENDAIISDMLNHASIIDGVRLCKAKRFRYANNDMESLEEQLILSKNCEKILIVTDGVFSMDGIIANLREICNLADKYNALVMVDDSHAVGVLGENGKGSIEYCDVIDRVDIVTGTLGKALGGASGGYTSGKKEIIDWLRQRSRPYLFSNTLAPVIAATSIKALNLVQNNKEKRNTLHSNSQYFRDKMLEKGFCLSGSNHPIIPVIVEDAVLAKQMADELNKRGIFVVNFSFPVVPKNKARIRVQISSSHTKENLDYAIANFDEIGKKLKII